MLARPLAICTLLAAAGTSAPAQAPVLLRLGGAVGRPVRTRVVATTYMGGAGMGPGAGDSVRMSMRVASYHTQTLDAVRGDTLTYTVRVDSTVLDSPQSLELATMLAATGAASPRTTTVRMDTRGHPFASDPGTDQGAGALPGSLGGPNDMGPGLLLPERPVRPGDSWADSVSFPFPAEAGGTAMVHVQCRFERLEARGGSGAAVVSLRALIPLTLAGSRVEIPVAAVYTLDVAARRITSSAGSTAITMRTPMGDVTTRSEVSEAELGATPPAAPEMREPAVVILQGPDVAGPPNPPAPSGDSAEPVGVELSPAPQRFTVVRLGTPEGQLNALLAEQVRRARAAGRRAFAYFDAAWCGPCRSLKRSLGDPRMVDAFAGTYIVKIDLDRWSARLDGTGFDVQAIPVFFELDDVGRPTGRRIDGGAWGEDIPENMAPPLRAFFQRRDR